MRPQQIAIECLGGTPHTGVQLAGAENLFVAVDANSAVQAIDGKTVFRGEQQQAVGSSHPLHRSRRKLDQHVISRDANEVFDCEIVPGEHDGGCSLASLAWRRHRYAEAQARDDATKRAQSRSHAASSSVSRTTERNARLASSRGSCA